MSEFTQDEFEEVIQVFELQIAQVTKRLDCYARTKGYLTWLEYFRTFTVGYQGKIRRTVKSQLKVLIDQRGRHVKIHSSRS